MDDLFKKLKELQGISSTNLKKQFIKDNKSNILFMDTLRFLLNPYVVTNISKAKINKKIKPVKTSRQLENLWDMYKFLENECTGKDKDIFILQSFLETCKYKDEVKELITKSMRLGVQAKLVNTALGEEFIPQFGVQLANSYDKHKNKVNGMFILTTKLDGVRIIATKHNGKVICYSRQGKEIEGLVDIVNELEQIQEDNFVIDGELVATGDFNDSSEMYKETIMRSRIKGKKHGLKILAYDYIDDINKFFEGKDNTPCHTRKYNLQKLLMKYDLTYIEYLSPLYTGTDKKEILTQLQLAQQKHEEGIMINLANAPYETKRTSNLLKVKTFHEADVLVTDILEGDGRLSRTTGKLEIQFKYEGEIYTNYLGSGLSDSEREYYWNHKDELINKVITISYFEITKNQDDGVGLRFPTWKGKEYIRTDKEGIESTNID